MAAEAEIRIGVETENAERNIAAFQGAIDVLGGSLEVAVGGLALFGVSEEQIEGIESAALGAIAFADGSKRLADGLIALAQNTNIAKNAQKAFNLAANANPYILAGTAIVATIGAVAAAYALLSDNVDETAESVDDLNEAIDSLADGTGDLSKFTAELENLVGVAFPEDPTGVPDELQRAINLYGDLTVAIQESLDRQTIAEQAAAGVEDELFQQRFRNFQFFTDERLAEFQKRYELELELDEENEFARQSLAAIRAVQQINEEQTLQFQLNNLLEDALAAREKLYDDYLASIAEKTETRGENLVELETKQAEQLTVSVDKTLKTGGQIISDNLEEQTFTRFQSYQRALDKFREETVESIGETAQLLGEDVIKAASFASDLITIFEKDGEERAKKQFELAKKVNISLAVINGAAAITEVLKDPSIPTTLGKVAASVGIAATTAAQIATIQRQQFDSPPGELDVEGGDGGGGGGALAGFNDFSLEAAQRQQALIGGTIAGETTVKAYVVSGEVTSGQQADQQLQNRRTL